jgi:hypothetical protein
MVITRNDARDTAKREALVEKTLNIALVIVRPG